MRIVVAPDKFKGSLSAPAAARAIATGLRHCLPQAEIVELPVADGGEGTLDALLAAGAVRITTTVRGPLGAPIEAHWGKLGELAVVELAAASGLAHIVPTAINAAVASTAGTGDLIKAALDDGLRRLLIGVGGSASTDAGAGAAAALGVALLDRHGLPLPPGGVALNRLDQIDSARRDPRLATAELTVACDVAYPLLGDTGSAKLFSAQKGADPAVMDLLATGLERFGAVVERQTGIAVAAAPWTGAGGGFAAGAMALLGAAPARGVDVILDAVGFDRAVAGADLVVTGEGALDDQSLGGKVPVGVAARAARLGVPAVAVAGRCTIGRRTLRAHHLFDVVALEKVAGSTEAALSDPHRWAAAAAEHLLRHYLHTR